ncbi:MAG: C2H2-type zinc finger protein [Candidatus Nitrosopolaris sp.]
MYAKRFEENNPKKKMANQITDEARQDPLDTQKNQATTKGIKDSQAVNESGERKDFPEVTPTAMSDFICKKCGKFYQTPDDLARHKKFEEGETQYKNIRNKSRTDRQETTRISAEEISSSTQDNPDKDIDDILKLIQNKPQINVKYISVYEVEKAANLVVEIK